MPMPTADPPGTVLATAVVDWVITIAWPNDSVGTEVPDGEQAQDGELQPGHVGDRGPYLGQVDLLEQEVEDDHDQHQGQHALDDHAGPRPAAGHGWLLVDHHITPLSAPGG